jgi:cobyrinic acid a,c-diamide synthase
VLIAATHSGAGKTTVTNVILRSLKDHGLVVQSFKHGPDFIDPAYHREITGRPAINLDLWMMGADGVRDGFQRWSADADVSVIESMGALYDGADGTEHGSPAQLAKLLDIPVVVIIDVWGMTRTAGAILAGLRAFDDQVRISGCILNRVGGPAHAKMIIDSLSDQLAELVIGTVEHRPTLQVPERHLGLVTVEENTTSRADREAAQRTAAEHLDLDRLLRLGEIQDRRPETEPMTSAEPRARLAIARDAAFCFYYEENLAALQRAGFDLVPFSPIHDHQLPGDIDAIYLGGGYPESKARELAANDQLAGQLRERAEAGMPIYAECGGLMYLARTLTGFDGVRHPMTGVLPIDVIMDRTYLAINYVEAATLAASPLGGVGTSIRGQEFHQSRITSADLEPNLFQVTTSSGDEFRAGYLYRNVVASYLHLHFARHRDLPQALRTAAIGG